MKAAALILLPIGLVAIAYACALAEKRRPVPVFETPEWTLDRYGRAHPTGFHSTLPASPVYNPPPPRED